MKRLGALLLLALSAGVAGSLGQPVAAAKEPAVARATAVLAIVGQQPKLVWLNPRTLKPLERGAVRLAGTQSPVFSPTGGRIAVGSSAQGVQIVDVFRMKLLARMARRPGWGVSPIAWPGERRLLALESDQRPSHSALIVVDPASRRVLRRTALDGFWGSIAAAGRHVVSIGGPPGRIGPARVVVADADGAVRSVVLDRIPAGGGVEEGPEEEPTYRTAYPGLAVDPVARRAYVVGQAPVVAEIDLNSLAVSYRELSRTASLLGRLLNWLEPAAQAKVVTGWSRQLVWLGDGLLAVAGTDYDRLRRVPSGLELIDVRAGTLRRLEDRASFALTAGSLLLAAGATNDGRGGAWSGMGVVAYTLGGEELWRALGGEPVSWLQTAGGYAYVDAPDPPVRVIDLGTGAVRKVRARMPFFVTP